MLKVEMLVLRLNEAITILSNRGKSRRRSWWWPSRVSCHQVSTLRLSCKATSNPRTQACLSCQWKPSRSNWLALRLDNPNSQRATQWLFPPTRSNKCRTRIRCWDSKFWSGLQITPQPLFTNSRWTRPTSFKCSSTASNNNRCFSRWKEAAKFLPKPR